LLAVRIIEVNTKRVFKRYLAKICVDNDFFWC